MHAWALLLHEISRGNRRAADDLLPMIYDELRRLARAGANVIAPSPTM